MSLARLALLLALASVPAACRLAQGPSAVAQGRYFATGNPNYDEFFVRLYRMQVELKGAPETLASIRANLTQGLALPPTSDTRAIGAALGTKASEIGGRGATLDVARGPEPEARVRLNVSGTPAEKDRPLVKTLDDSLARLGELRGRFGAWRRELDWLPPSGVALDGSVEAAFVGQSRGTREDVHENLADAQKVVALMTSRMKEIDESSAELERLFVGALGQTRAPEPPSEEPKTKPRPASRPPVAASPRHPAPAAEPASGELPPASKPKQGTAKPDFEP